MADIEQTLRRAMHAAVDGAEPSPEELIIAVRQRHRRHRARLAVSAVLAAVAIAVPTVVAVHDAISSSRSSSNQAAAGGTKPSSALSGLPMPPGMNFEVLNTTLYGASWYSTATHATAAIKGLPAVLGGYQFSRVNGGWVATPVNYNAPCDTSECAGPPTTFYFIAEGSLTATRIGSGYWGDGVGPGTEAGTLWLVTQPPPPTSKWYTAARAQLVTTTGRPLGPRYRLPAYALMQGGVGSNLLLDIDKYNYVPSALWDPQTGRVIRYFENVIARSPQLIIWTRGCQRCHLQITNVTTGKTLTTPILGGHQDIHGNDSLNSSLSDDGRLLAVQLPSGELAVLNTATLSLTRIPGTALTKADFENFGWQNGGHRLVVFAGPNGPGADQLAFWQPGDKHLYVQTIRNPSEMEQLQTGSV